MNSVTLDSISQRAVKPSWFAFFFLSMVAAFHLAAPSPVSAAERSVVPFSGTVSGKVIGRPASQTDPFLYAVALAGSGPSSVGNITAAGTHLTHADLGTIVNGSVVFRAPGGYLYGTYTGSEFPTADPNVVLVSGNIIITGGSSTFRNASGIIPFTGSLKITGVSPTGVITEDFRLAFNGSLRR